MKIYVDELPKSCDKCPFNVKTMFFSEKNLESVGWVNNCKLGFSFGCRLQSLADHDKQVRKEVCEEIRTELIEYLFDWYEEEDNANSELYIDVDRVWEILDQIQGETK